MNAWRCLVLAASLAIPASAALSQPLLVRVLTATSVGQGTLFRFRDGCFALTAGHVMNGQAQASLVGGSYARVTGAGRLVKQFTDPDDLALLRVTGALAQPELCNTDMLELVTDAERLNRGGVNGSLASVDEEGRLARMAVLFVRPRPELLQIRPADGEHALTVGRSGSLVFQNERPIGIFLAQAPKESGGGTAMMTTQRAVQLVEQWFAQPQVQAGAVAALPLAGSEAGNLLDPRRGAEVVDWNTLPETPDRGPDQLISLEPPGIWVARLPNRDKASAVLRLAGGAAEPLTLARIEIDAPIGQPPARWASEVEVQHSLSGTAGSWTTFGETALLHSDEPTKVLQPAPKLARYLRIILHKNRGDPTVVAVGRVRAFSKQQALP